MKDGVQRMAQKRKINNADERKNLKEQIIELFKCNLTVAEIARQLRVSEWRVTNVLLDTLYR